VGHPHGGILGIVAMRLVIGKLLALIQRYPALVDGAFVIIAWVGIKLLLEFAHQQGYVHFEIPKWIALGLIVVIFAIRVLLRAEAPARRSRRGSCAPT
jgi:predicted tellurium resistance membrane protein TerC